MRYFNFDFLRHVCSEQHNETNLEFFLGYKYNVLYKINDYSYFILFRTATHFTIVTKIHYYSKIQKFGSPGRPIDCNCPTELTNS